MVVRINRKHLLQYAMLQCQGYCSAFMREFGNAKFVAMFSDFGCKVVNNFDEIFSSLRRLELHGSSDDVVSFCITRVCYICCLIDDFVKKNREICDNPDSILFFKTRLLGGFYEKYYYKTDILFLGFVRRYLKDEKISRNRIEERNGSIVSVDLRKGKDEKEADEGSNNKSRYFNDRYVETLCALWRITVNFVANLLFYSLISCIFAVFFYYYFVSNELIYERSNEIDIFIIGFYYSLAVFMVSRIANMIE